MVVDFTKIKKGGVSITDFILSLDRRRIDKIEKSENG